jgi:hypothetical protein
MRARDSNKILLATLVLLALSSVELKAISGSARNPNKIPPSQVEAELVKKLRSEGFTTSIRLSKISQSIVYAQRGSCRLIVRDARNSEADPLIFNEDAKSIGPSRYLYRGYAYSSLPSLRVRLGRFQTELLDFAGLRPRVHVPVALASSPSCGGGDFGFRDVQVGIS